MTDLKEGFVAEWRPDERQVRAILGGLDEALLVYELGGTLRYVNTAALNEKFSYLYLGANRLSVDLELRTLDNELVPPTKRPWSGRCAPKVSATLRCASGTWQLDSAGYTVVAAGRCSKTACCVW